MNLRRQLLLVSVLTLILPWAGCQFVRETEIALRQGQAQMLSGTALAIADFLAQFPDELLGADGDQQRGASQLYGHPLLSAPLVDGYLDDWSVQEEATATLRGTDGVIRYIIGIYRRDLYLHLDVRDVSLVHADMQTPRAGSGSDFVSLVSEDESGTQTIFRFRTEAPGPVVATREVDGLANDETRIEAVWRDTATGYQVEARVPRSLLGKKLGIAVNNTADTNSPGVQSKTWTGESPGLFRTVSPLLQSVAAGYVQRDRDLRLMITDAYGWRVALAGDLSNASGDGTIQAPDNRWLRMAYDLILEPGEEAALATPDPSGREQLSYIAEALQGETTPAPRWFRSQETGRAVLSIAQPIFAGNVQTGAIVLQRSTEANLSLANQALTRLISLTIVATLAVAIVLLGYATWLSYRIRSLSSAAEAALDENAVRTDLPSALAGDEIGDLSRSFSHVLQQLGDYNNYLRTLASKLSHELRTPLTIVRSSLENLEHEKLSRDGEEYTARAKDGVERLGTILNAMSEASRTEELMQNVEEEQFEIGPVIESAVRAYSDAWPKREFRFHERGAGSMVLGSPELIIQMLDKLVDNAVDFSTDGAVIDIEAVREEDNFYLRVSNPGKPLPEEMRTQLFHSMVSVRDGDAGKHLGLGLHVARLIAEGHGGTINARNTKSGVTFEVQLPLLNVPAVT